MTPCGRFAPTPSGPLHFGSLVTALASFLQMRSTGGRWLVRIEDIDLPRCIPGAAERILFTLEAHGFTWDGEVIYQSQRTELYQEAFKILQQAGAVYSCTCTRRTIAKEPLSIDGAPRYPGWCRDKIGTSNTGDAWRLRTSAAVIRFTDELQGPCQQEVEREVGDFVILRSDGVFSYQLCVVVDDAAQGVTHVLRGADLIDSTARQMMLQKILHYPEPRYTHIPIALNQAGEKLSKQTKAPPILCENASKNLLHALQFLEQNPPSNLEGESPKRILQWAIAHWNFSAVPRVRQMRSL